MTRRYSTVFDRFEMALEWFQTVCWPSTPAPNQEQSPVALPETTFYRANDPFQPQKHPQKGLGSPPKPVRVTPALVVPRAPRLLAGENMPNIR